MDTVVVLSLLLGLVVIRALVGVVVDNGAVVPCRVNVVDAVVVLGLLLLIGILLTLVVVVAEWSVRHANSVVSHGVVVVLILFVGSLILGVGGQVTW